MKRQIELEQEDYDCLHDVILGALNIKPTKAELIVYFNMLPESIKDLAYTWGFNDSVFRDDAYVFFQNMEQN